jgi:hypothetical protein
MECAARAWWSLDPKIDLKTRVLRGLLELFHSDWETSRIAPVLESGQRRIEEIKRGAAELSLGIETRRRDGRIKALGDETFRSFEYVIDDELGDRGVLAYKMLSAVSHGVVFGLLDVSDVVVPPLGGVGIIQPGTLPKSVVLRLQYAVYAFLRAFGRQVQLYGWDPTFAPSFRG